MQEGEAREWSRAFARVARDRLEDLASLKVWDFLGGLEDFLMRDEEREDLRGTWTDSKSEIDKASLCSSSLILAEFSLTLCSNVAK
jgi:hypothetical protein